MVVVGGGWSWSMQMTDVLEPRIRDSQPRSRSRVNISTISTTSRLFGGEAQHSAPPILGMGR